MDMVMTAREIVAELVGEQNGEECERERQSAGQSEWLAIEEGERSNEFVPGDCLILRIGRGEVRACDQTGAKRQEK